MIDMLLPDVTEILDDLEVGGGQPFDVIRITRSLGWLNGGDSSSEEVFHATGNIQPAGSKDLQQLQPEDRLNSVMVVRTTFTLGLGHQTEGGQVDPDIIVYRGRKYKVLRLEDWSAWGFVTAYITERKEAEE